MGRPMIPSPMNPIGPCMTPSPPEVAQVARGGPGGSLAHARVKTWKTRRL
jgi:hypothetical protein